jgi:hypothetical protein
MASRSPELVTSLGIAGTYYAATIGGGGDRVPPGALLHVKTAGTATTLTLFTNAVIDGDLTIADRTVSLAATDAKFVRVPTLDAYRDPSDGLVLLNWSAVTAVTFAVLS